MRFLLKTVSLLSLLLAGLGVQAAEWQIDNAQSQLSFVSTKKVNVAEVHHFGMLTGGLSEAGEFDLAIDLESVNTGIDIRDSRMREFLFDVVDFPEANLVARVAPDFVNSLKVGESKASTVDGELSLHGQHQPLSFEVLVTKISETELLVNSAKPLILNVSDFELVQGVEKLRELAGLPSISHAVPVSFYLTLNAME